VGEVELRRTVDRLSVLASPSTRATSSPQPGRDLDGRLVIDVHAVLTQFGFDEGDPVAVREPTLTSTTDVAPSEFVGLGAPPPPRDQDDVGRRSLIHARTSVTSSATNDLRVTNHHDATLDEERRRVERFDTRGVIGSPQTR